MFPTIDDTPAYRAGVQAGDYITHLDDKAVMGMTLSEAVDKMRGQLEPLSISLCTREGEKDALNFNIVRDVIKIKSVRSNTFDKSIGYIRITTFNQNTYDGLKEAFASIKRAW